METWGVAQISAILLGFMLTFFTMWLYSDYTVKKKKKYLATTLEIITTVLVSISAICFSLEIILEVSPSSSTSENTLWWLLTFGIITLVGTFMFATIYDYFCVESKNKEKKNGNK
jgi:hypothetical protein